MSRIALDDDRDFLVYRPGSGGTVEIFDIVVGSERRKGRGRELVSRLLQQFPPDTRVYAITRASNFIAHEFYEALGFQVVAPLREFYSGEHTIDAVMYGRKCGGVV